MTIRVAIRPAREVRILPLVLMLATGWGGAGAAPAQDRPPVPSGAAAADSIQVLASARSRQADFERIRLRYLPVTWSSSGGRCDERIGRFCLNHDDGVDWKIPPEHREVAAARSELIADLEAARRRLPGEAWINGQLVRYLVEERRHDEAVAAATECRAEAGWCSALLGFAYHYAGTPGEAEAAFAAALHALGEAERVRWTDLSMILSGPPATAYRRLANADRVAFEERFWALADPLFTRPGNELRSEHFARHVRERLQERAESPEGSSFSADQRQVLIRYGWPLGWERVEMSPGQLGPAPLIAHLGSSPFVLLPPVDALLGQPPADDWDAPSPAPRAEYEIPLKDSIATWIFPLDHQFAVFHRDAGPLLIAAYTLPPDSTPLDAKVHSALGYVPFDLPGPGIAAAARETIGRRGAHAVSLPVESGVVASLELVVPETRLLARARRFFPPYPASGGPGISDLLLIDPDAPLPDSLSAALPKARGSTAVFAGEDIGIFWEFYGVDAGSSATIDVTLRFAQQGSAGLLRRIAERVGLARENVPIRLEWEEPVPDGDILARSITIRIPSSAAGDHILELTMTRPNGPPIVTTRSVRVLRR